VLCSATQYSSTVQTSARATAGNVRATVASNHSAAPDKVSSSPG
jgi:hypothetical protein